MKLRTYAVMGTLLAATAWPVLADDLVPPPWTRPTGHGTENWGHPGGPADATWSSWDTFGGLVVQAGPQAATIHSDAAAWGAHVVPTPGPLGYPVVNNQFTGRANVHNFGAASTLIPGDTSGRTTVAELSGDFSFLIPNTPYDHNAYKLIQVQLTWKPEAADAVPFLHADATDLKGIMDNQWTKVTTPLADGWFQSTYSGMGFYELPPGVAIHNPTGETFQVTGNIFLDQVVIDTVCIPEPGQVAMMSLTLVGAAGYGLRRFVLRRQR